MATITASNFAAVLPKATLKGSYKVQSSPVLGLPVMATNGRVRCTLEQKRSASSMSLNPSMVASLMAAAAAAMTTTAGPAMALVDERLSTEGTGLPFGLSNNLLGWILFGAFGLIWALYFIYVSSLEEDEDSGLSL
ncbi:Photosystem II reaction center W protein, chloroplastic, putative [Theobroma cacao]|uniref:PSII 6.1 kDa protein n=1 Tax=Theobroma cacao TaxID=3641 RepID=A0A061F2Y4_THECC|nr:Photosystem II reaction center W protein, chloroplastic, putative [Theobroma cacao]